jgi:hypothetical protein
MATAGHLYDPGPLLRPFILSEANGGRSRSVAIVTQAGAALESGTPLTLVAGKYVPYTNTAPGDTAHAVLYERLPAATGDKKAVVIDVDAVLNRFEMSWGALDNTAITAAIADLSAKGIKVDGTPSAKTISTPAL